jgi:hypothetical protein
MDKEKIVKAFDKFVDDKYAESEEILRKEIKSAINDHLKNKLELQKDPIEIEPDDTDDVDNSDADDE